MSRQCSPFVLAVLAVAGVLTGACKTGGPQTPVAAAPAPESLQHYVGELRLIAHSQVGAALGKGRAKATCDLAVQVKAVAFDKGLAHIAVETVGLPRVAGPETRCLEPQAALQLAVSLPAGANPEQVSAKLDEVLLTPEAFLKTKGIAFDLTAGEAPREVACREPFATADEERVARKVTVWPEQRLAVHPLFRASSRDARQEGEVEVDAIVGTDGRLYSPNLRTRLGSSHEPIVQRAMALWRFAPARKGEEPVGAHLLLRPVLRIY